MPKVKSRDGTYIAYDESGSGPALVLVCGASVDRSSHAQLAVLLAAAFTVFNYDRRGRGGSGDTPPYAVAREVEDIEAVISATGGPSFLYGASSGAALALEAAYRLPDRITRLALWEPPFFVDADTPRPPADAARTFSRLISQGQRGEAVEFFMSKVVGLPPAFVASARRAPWWPAQEAIAHTLVYDATIMGDYSLPVAHLTAINIPTLVMVGGSSPTFMRHTAEALGKILPRGQLRQLKGQQHDASAGALVAALTGFFTTA